jgi:signal peptidase I
MNADACIGTGRELTDGRGKFQVRVPSRRFLLWTLLLVCLAFLAFLRVKYQFVMVVGESMEPNYSTGDLLLIDRNAYRRRDPARGDVVVAWYQGGTIVKRIVGLPGETIEVRSGEVYIEGRPVLESHLIEPGNLSVSRGLLGAQRYALLGDNRSMSSDMSVHGVVGPEDILGRVIFVR